MNMIDVYQEEYNENFNLINKKLFTQDSDAKYKEVNNLLKENQNIVRISNWEASNLSPSLK
jgi:hypothetical protein